MDSLIDTTHNIQLHSQSFIIKKILYCGHPKSVNLGTRESAKNRES